MVTGFKLTGFSSGSFASMITVIYFFRSAIVIAMRVSASCNSVLLSFFSIWNSDLFASLTVLISLRTFLICPS